MRILIDEYPDYRDNNSGNAKCIFEKKHICTLTNDYLHCGIKQSKSNEKCYFLISFDDYINEIKEENNKSDPFEMSTVHMHWNEITTFDYIVVEYDIMGEREREFFLKFEGDVIELRSHTVSNEEEFISDYQKYKNTTFYIYQHDPYILSDRIHLNEFKEEFDDILKDHTHELWGSVHKLELV